MARVFISHARDGLDQAAEIHQWLTETGHEVFLDRDRRDGIGLGEKWRERLHERLRWADAVVCIVTSEYMSSKWCTVEVEIARSRGSKLLPVIAEEGPAPRLFESIQYVASYTDNPLLVREKIAGALLRIDSTGGLGWPDDRSPFPGLQPLEPDQHRVFFGRGEEKTELAQLIRSMSERAEKPAILTVVGPSGCGKSSLVRAGLLPLMGNEPGWQALGPFVPGSNPVRVLVNEIVSTSRRLGLDWTEAYVVRYLDEFPLADLVDRLLLAAPAGWQRRLLIVVDQFEELLTLTSATERTRFANMLRSAAAASAQVVATLRPEFLDQMLISQELSTLLKHTYMLRPLSRGALRTVVEGPARLAGIGVDEHLVARLIADTASGEALPLLAFTLSRLALGVSRGGQLSYERYEQLGGVQGALVGEAEAALAQAVTAAGMSRDEVIAGLLRLVTVDEQGHPIRWHVNRDELSYAVATALDKFVTRRLLSTDTDLQSRKVIIGVTHEAFLSAWPPLADAITIAASALRARSAIEQAATDWVDNERMRSLLWLGGQLAAAVANTGAHVVPPSASPTVNSSATGQLTKERDSVPLVALGRPRVLVTERVELSLKARDFLLASIRRDRARRRRTATVLSGFLIAALLGAAIAVVQRGDAKKQQQIAIGRQLVAQAESIRDTDPRTALRLNISASDIYPSQETHSGLVGILASSPYRGTLKGSGGGIPSIAFNSDGQTVALGNDDGTAVLWEVAVSSQPRQVARPISGHTGPVNSTAFAPDGRTLATGSRDGTAILWDVTDRTDPRRLGKPLTGHAGPLNSVAFSPDGLTLSTAGDDGAAILWDLTDRNNPRRLGKPLKGHAGPLNSVAFSPDSLTLATANSDGTAVLWNVADTAQPRQFPQRLAGHASAVQFIAFAPDGRTVATASADGTSILWDVDDRTRPRQLRQFFAGNGGVITSAAFAPNGSSLVTASSNGFAIRWDVYDNIRQLGRPLVGHVGVVTALVFDGNILKTIGSDGKLVVWDIADRAEPVRVGEPKNQPDSLTTYLAASPDSKTLVTRTPDGNAVLWDAADRSRLRKLGRPLATGHGQVTSAAFGPDGHTLATANFDGTVINWDISNRSQPRQLGQPLAGHRGPVTAVAFTLDGRTLATSSSDGTAILWDITDRVRSRQLGRPLESHSGSVNSVAFASDGRTLATANSDGSVILWDIGPLNDIRSQAVHRACAIADGSLTRDEWKRYVSGTEYRNSCIPSGG
jgi:WD40 repeat protein